EVLAFHRQLEPSALASVNGFVQSERAEIRQKAWRVLALAEPRAAALYQAGIADPDLNVRRLALETACWGGQSWLLPHLRKLAGRPAALDFDALDLLAVLGTI